MRQANPAFTPRHHRVEAALVAAIERDDYGPFEELLLVLSRPYEDHPPLAGCSEPPSPRAARTAPSAAPDVAALRFNSLLRHAAMRIGDRDGDRPRPQTADPDR